MNVKVENLRATYRIPDLCRTGCENAFAVELKLLSLPQGLIHVCHRDGEFRHDATFKDRLWDVIEQSSEDVVIRTLTIERCDGICQADCVIARFGRGLGQAIEGLAVGYDDSQKP